MSFYICIVWSPLPTLGILNVYPRIGSLGLFLGILPLFVTRNHDIFSSLELVGKPCPMTFGVKSQGYCKNGKFNPLVRSFVAFLNSSSNLCLYNLFYLLVLQFLIVQTWRVQITDGFRLPLPLLERSRILMTWSILVICSPIALDLSLPNTSWKRSIERKKVSRLILVASRLSFSL